MPEMRESDAEASETGDTQTEVFPPGGMRERGELPASLEEAQCQYWALEGHRLLELIEATALQAEVAMAMLRGAGGGYDNEAVSRRLGTIRRSAGRARKIMQRQHKKRPEPVVRMNSPLPPWLRWGNAASVLIYAGGVATQAAIASGIWSML